MSVGVIFMTALVPTTGHKRLIDFAEAFMNRDGGVLVVIVSSRSFEPRITRDRVKIFREIWPDVVFIDHLDDNAPQNPETEEEWQYWVDQTSLQHVDYIFGSENYCITLAEKFNATYIPCDPYREVYSVVGTGVRYGLPFDSSNVLEEWVLDKKTNYIFFGQESVGKTTMAKYFSNLGIAKTPFFHEWARPFLETVGSEVTTKKMREIARAQRYVDEEAQAFPALATFQDTDLVSTLGYLEFWDPTGDHSWLEKIILERDNSKRTYIILSPEEVPFEADVLRYGVNKRETDVDFWVNLLKRLHLKFIVVGGSFQDRITNITKLVKEPFKEILTFKRD